MDRSLVLSVSAGTGYYRHIQISEGAVLYELHEAILESFGFDDDHMHAFFMNNRAWDEDAVYICPEGELNGSRGFTTKAKLSKFRLSKGSRFLYIFDFGDDWRFSIKVLHVVEEATPKPIVLKRVGEIDQYGCSDYDEDDYDDEEDALDENEAE